MNNEICTCSSKDCRIHGKGISFRAVMAGALVAVGLGFLLNLFGIAIGLSAFTTNKAGLMSLAIGGYIGMAIGVVVSMYFAGWVTGYLSRRITANRHLGSLYGLTTWCLALVISVVLAAPVSAYIASFHHSFYSSNTSMSTSSNMNKTTTMESDRSNRNATSNTNRVTHQDEKAVNTAGLSLVLTFVLFFLGALSSAFGGYCGLRPKEENYTKNKNK